MALADCPTNNAATLTPAASKFLANFIVTPGPNSLATN